MYSEPPPILPPIPPPQERKSKAKVVGIIIVAAMLIGAMGGYFLILAPRMSVVDWSHTDVPFPVSVAEWQYSFTVVVKNAGYFAGKTDIVCTFSFEDRDPNGSVQTRTFENSLRVELRGGEQEEFPVHVKLSMGYAAVSLLTQNKTWSVHLD